MSTEIFHKYWWIPIAIVWYATSAWLSKKSNEESGIYFYLLLFSQFCPLWTFVALRSSNLIFDALLYDIIICGSFLTMLIYIGCSKSFNIYQYIGLFIIILGFSIMKFGEVMNQKG